MYRTNVAVDIEEKEEYSVTLEGDFFLLPIRAAKITDLSNDMIRDIYRMLTSTYRKFDFKGIDKVIQGWIKSDPSITCLSRSELCIKRPLSPEECTEKGIPYDASDIPHIPYISIRPGEVPEFFPAKMFAGKKEGDSLYLKIPVTGVLMESGSFVDVLIKCTVRLTQHRSLFSNEIKNFEGLFSEIMNPTVYNFT